ncbi:hypothetical protein L1987_21369 [Smallanthus sonchifolius]|uniref:Uncharacterized protein n=1 Tax=Smallanthus sonchifolius TaxID=185202 RepID=A0ACB9ITT1_9ASTR|nr:hypothetical protein L1987_21369 [Smallanthus sonchifolius]
MHVPNGIMGWLFLVKISSFEVTFARMPVSNLTGIQFQTTNGHFQVENEYGNVEWAYGVGGDLYVKWAAETALNLNTSVPWVMCSQSDAPDPITNGTCSGGLWCF